MTKIIYITLSVLAFALVLLAVVILGHSNSPAENPPDTVFCTQDAQLCPDGSYVGRQGPNCEFAPCP